MKNNVDTETRSEIVKYFTANKMTFAPHIYPHYTLLLCHNFE